MNASSDTGEAKLTKQISNIAALDPDEYEKEISNDDMDSSFKPRIFKERERALDQDLLEGISKSQY